MLKNDSVWMGHTRREALRGLFGAVAFGFGGVLGHRRAIADALPKTIEKTIELSPFEREMFDHCRAFDTSLDDRLEPGAIAHFVRQSYTRAQSFGFTLRGPTRTFIELSLMFGSAFDTDPQYPWAERILRGPGEEMVKATALYDETMRYRRHISFWAERRALVRWESERWDPPVLGESRLVDAMVNRMQRLFPEKATYVGAEALGALAREAILESEHRELSSPSAKALMVALFFALGHGVTRDALYPMIGAALQEKRDREARLRRTVAGWVARTLRW
ncbi:MAG: hypothetical protein IPK13_24985 [Deltaproteobacteria bacterium]|nr:hypothetical protein [Deltaproteobacteria bacterium]